MATTKLEDFRLQVHEERSLLLSAVHHYRVWLEQHNISSQELEALILRLSRTECQPGGCSLCNPDVDDRGSWDD